MIEICESCGGEIRNPKSVVRIDGLVLCLSCYESERQSTPQFGVEDQPDQGYEDEYERANRSPTPISLYEEMRHERYGQGVEIDEWEAA